MGAIDRIRAIFDEKFAERLAEEDNVRRSPEGARDRLADVLSRGRKTKAEEEEARKKREKWGAAEANDRRMATADADRG